LTVENARSPRAFSFLADDHFQQPVLQELSAHRLNSTQSSSASWGQHVNVIESIPMIMDGAAGRTLPTGAVIAAFLDACMKESRAGIRLPGMRGDRHSAFTVGTAVIAHDGILHGGVCSSRHFGAGHDALSQRPLGSGKQDKPCCKRSNDLYGSHAECHHSLLCC
jgi:hypothetical protein